MQSFKNLNHYKIKDFYERVRVLTENGYDQRNLDIFNAIVAFERDKGTRCH